MEIKFSTNWNWKLANKKFLTTIRLNSSKYRIGEIYDLTCNEFTVKAKLVKYEVRKWEEFNDFELCLDTGYDRVASEKVFKSFYPKLDFETQDFLYMLFEKINIKEEMQGGIFD